MRRVWLSRLKALWHCRARMVRWCTVTLPKLRAAGVESSEIANHDDSEYGLSERWHEGTFVRSLYFQDPDGILLEFAAWTRPFSEADVSHPPNGAVRPRP